MILTQLREQLVDQARAIVAAFCGRQLLTCLLGGSGRPPCPCQVFFKKCPQRNYPKFALLVSATFNLPAQEAYEDSLKNYRDLKNVVHTSREEGMQEGVVKN